MHPGDLSPGPLPAALAGEVPPATEAAAKAREAKASRGDGHTLRAEDAANGSGGGGSDGGVLREGAEDGSGQGHHHGRGLDEDVGVLALPDAGLVAAAAQRGGAAGLAGQAWHALVVAGHGLSVEGHLLGQRVRRTPKRERSIPPSQQERAKALCWPGIWRLCKGARVLVFPSGPTGPASSSQAQAGPCLACGSGDLLARYPTCCPLSSPSLCCRAKTQQRMKTLA